MSLTDAQKEAIAARGNVVVVAGAGTGKTSTLVDRCLSCLVNEEPPASLDQILIVTFTDAAAAEIRKRIRARLEHQLQLAPDQPRWHEQLALFETAHIGTLHSFCLQLIRQHFYELELDPQLSVVSEEESRLLADDTLSALIEKHYAGQTSTADDVQQLIQIQGNGSDKPIRSLVFRLHDYTQTLPDPRAWVEDRLREFAEPGPARWHQWLLDAIPDYRQLWMPFLQEISTENAIASQCAAVLARLGAYPTSAEAAKALEEVSAARKTCPEGKKGAFLDPLQEFLDETDFLSSLFATHETADSIDPLAEDWAWVRLQMITLLELAREFTGALAETKRELGVVDFHDLEQHALKLLWDPVRKQPSAIARQWRETLRFVFVDEYQDINAAQDKIIEALGREGTQANRFLVGDVKQSIYRFRLANPYIFQGYVNRWSKNPSGRTQHETPQSALQPGGPSGQAIPLVENFRSREGVLNFVNSFFSTVMQPELGGVRYDEQARLLFGAPDERRALTVAADSTPAVELHLRLRKSRKTQDEEDTPEELLGLAGLAEAEKEARGIALSLRELKARNYPVWDDSTRSFRPVEWGDMAILLRSPARKSESFAKEFSRLGIPLLVERSGFYDAVEISDLLSLLQILDNPLQDLPVLAVLHSPLVGLSVNELATIRLTPDGPFWTTLVQWTEAQPENSQEPGTNDPHSQKGVPEPADTFRRVSTFLKQFSHWRRLARQVSLSRCLDAILSQTHYAAWLLTQPRGEQRHANVQRLLVLAQQFDRFHRQGLFRFLCFIEAQQVAETEPDVPSVSQENSVRLMSIHQSKGLEFPVVAVADLAKPFNVSDLRAEMILDEEFGLCPQVKPPQSGQRYPSLPHWLASRRQHRELLGEEMRLLYVAMTRAKDKLILSANLPAARFEKRWRPPARSSLRNLLGARNYSDWIGCWFSQHFNVDATSPSAGENAFLRWIIHDDLRLTGPGAEPVPAEPSLELSARDDSAVWSKLLDRLVWKYPFAQATQTPAKSSVTALRRRGIEPFPEELRSRSETGTRRGGDAGNADHRFLQLVSLDKVGSAQEMRTEAQKLGREEALTQDEIGLLDFDALAAFWQSDLGRQIRAQPQSVRRELVFTARFSIEELAELTGEPIENSLHDEFVVVQGVADLAVLLPSEIWLLDFKTDRPDPAELAHRIKEYERQLRLYARALSRIYNRPVSKCWLCFLALQKVVPVAQD